MVYPCKTKSVSLRLFPLKKEKFCDILRENFIRDLNTLLESMLFEKEFMSSSYSEDIADVTYSCIGSWNKEFFCFKGSHI